MIIPDGKTHLKAWKFFFPLNLLVAIYVGVFWNWYIAIWIAVGYLVHGFGIDPDTDLPNLHRGEALWVTWIIPIPLLGWSTLYSRIFRDFGGHRSYWTHSFLVSTFIRLMFFALPFLWFFRTYFVHGDLIREFLGLFVGMALADGIHILLDSISGEMRYANKIGGKSKLAKIILKILFDYPRSRKYENIP